MRKTREQMVIWAAGFFDGEGSVMIAKQRNYRGKNQREYGFRLIIGASNTDSKPLEQMVALFGGYITDAGIRKEGCKPTFHWRLVSDLAADALEEMLPWLVVKPKQAKLGIEFQSLRKKGQVTEVERERRFTRDTKLQEKMKTMNHRGTITVT